MYGKIQINGEIELVTGLHIGGSSAFAAIGAVDSPVIKDVRTNDPMIPGSSLKGKIRTLLASAYNKTLAKHPDDDDERILRLFGSAKKEDVKRSRLIFSDMFLANAEDLRKRGVQSLTEVKFENSINRATAVANPRQIERAIRGSVFALDLIYDVSSEGEIVEDFELLGDGLRLLQYDYLGGSGSRGYGKVKFQNLSAECVVGDVDEAIVDKCNEILNRAVSE